MTKEAIGSKSGYVGKIYIILKIIHFYYGHISAPNGSKSRIVLQKTELVKHEQWFLTLDEIHICMYIYFPIFQMSWTRLDLGWLKMAQSGLEEHFQIKWGQV